MDETICDTPRFERVSIRTLLIFAVNAPLVVAVAIWSPLHYQGEMHEAIAEKRADLQGEARTVFHGISLLPANTNEVSVQNYLDAVYLRLHDTQLTDHHIAIRMDGRILQPRTHAHDSPTQSQVLRIALRDSGNSLTKSNAQVAIGQYEEGDVGVYIAEDLTEMRRAIQVHLFSHLGWLASLAVGSGTVISFVIWKVITRPVQRLSNVVQRISQGEYLLKPDSSISKEVDLLSKSIGNMAKSLAAEQRDRSLRMLQARRVQSHLLPHDTELPGLSIAHLFLPADDVAGDYFDLIQVRDGSWLVCVADVSGHGVAAAMGSAMLKALLLRAAEHSSEPSKILQHINEWLPGLLPDEFVTMFLARWNVDTGQLRYASAGHEPGYLLLQDHRVRQLNSTGLPLGVDQKTSWESETITFCAGERLLLMTDGVPEAHGGDSILFGRERISNLLAKSRHRSLNHVVQAIESEVVCHQGNTRLSDDITLLLLESKPDGVNDACVAAVDRSNILTTTNMRNNHRRGA